ncbi:uncharacterized protein PHALS_14976 [Plasmopara halstedii]|uniref:Uncharacterized protein n=1 Tax=Plasmopara halstedii TaxID=4781 RepID=A0A0P1A7Y2_PLAHL|nr:uncharacterized protein PHALS_14976 [Plasmopara halstedii]CEG36778.1 hypothetical protein PHALS_14976 [Plasmopara halstedii]|eukprot:XP_024573147.1 hypothetical protein PHALS_14976 [Plasmopara halstedii]
MPLAPDSVCKRVNTVSQQRRLYHSNHFRLTKKLLHCQGPYILTRRLGIKSAASFLTCSHYCDEIEQCSLISMAYRYIFYFCKDFI